MSPSVCRLSSVCLSVTFVRPIQPVETFGNVSTPFGSPSVDFQVKFYGDRPRGTPLSGELNTRGVTKYSDFGNALPEDVVSVPSLSTFRRRLKTFHFHQSYLDLF